MTPNKNNRSRHSSSTGNDRIWFIVDILFFVLVAFFLFFFYIPIFSSQAPDEAVIKIPKNATQQNVRDSLTKYLGEEYTERVMKAGASRQDFSHRYGAYLIEKGASPRRAAKVLTRGQQHPVNLTFNGFRHIESLSDRIARKLNFTPDSLLNLLNDPQTLAEYGLKPGQALALFLDDTYQVYWTFSPKEVVEKMGSNYKKIWNEERTRKASELGLSPAEVMILCSIVDEESNKVDEKGEIGRLYINRLKKDMKLQADPTVRYAVGDFSLKRILNKHLTVDSPYNTYLHTGLPPGPIKTTSRQTIDEVLNSEPNDYLFMCAKADFSGYHAFAKDFEQHKENARLYQEELNRRGIK